MKTNKTISMTQKWASIWAFLFVVSFSFGQNNYSIQYQDEVLEVPENIQTFNWNQMPESSRLASGYYGWVQFYETPTQDIQDAFKANQLNLIEYISNSTYLFYFPNDTSISYLRDSGVRAIVPVEGRFKLSENLKNGIVEDWAVEGNNLLVTLVHYDNVNSSYVINDLAAHQISVKKQYRGSNNLDLSIPNNCLEDLSNLPYVKWVEYIVAPDVKDDDRGRGLHRSTNLDTQGAGRNYTGDGIGVMVRDDGIVGPHIDFQGRIDNSYASGSGQTHGDGVAGIMAGAGNLDPTKRGMAAGSNVFVSNYSASFLDAATVTLMNSGDVQITNSSYSNGCNAGYTTITQTVDQQTIDMPTVLHVFSAGNSNGNNCGYGAGTQWGNITGGHKQGKNVIATANVFFNGNLASSSSRGPAHDGRIKPDITAHGQGQLSTNENNGYLTFGGTSGAAPGIAGVSAQLYQAYAEANGGTLPPSALIKAAMLNTANDYGNVGPDFRFGWGIINGLRAGMLIEDERYLSDEVTQGNSNTHNISIPSGTKQVRFMLYWSDPAASAGATTALVNDLDLEVTDPSNGSHLPWILDSTPNPTTLNLPATTGADHLNNVEQVLINNPAAGSYTLDVSGFDIPVGPQEYFIVYEVITENLTLTYPNAGEKFVAGIQENIHWDAINTTASFELEYTLDDGANWNPITTVAANATNYLWNTNVGTSGEVKIRITSGSFSDESDDVFSISPLVTGFSLDQVCPSGATFSWNALAGANEYDIYILGEESMEVVGTTSGTDITVPLDNFTEQIWFSIAARSTVDGWEGRRRIASSHGGGVLNCVIADDIALNSINNTEEDFSAVCSTPNYVVSIDIENTGANAQSNFQVSYQISGQSPVVETYTQTLASGQEVTYEFNTPANIPANGQYQLTTMVMLTGDENEFNNEQVLDFFSYIETQDDLFEPFDVNGVPPSGWRINNIDDDLTWEEKDVAVGSNGNPTKTAYVNNSNYLADLARDEIFTDIYDLTGITSVNLTFDLAKAQASASDSDLLQVHISTDCGDSWTSLYNKNGLDLSTIPDYDDSNDWEPSSVDEWRREEIDISAYSGQNVLFRFTNICRTGNSTYIDNIFIDDLLSASDNTLETIAMYPNPTERFVTIATGTNFDARLKITIVNSLGQEIQAYASDIFNGSNKATLDISNFATGLYFVTISNGNQATTKKLLVK